ncbi:type II toxin-antitoxin system Phd/YefM family antitoxin [Chelatococcus sambhunathii]|uniref:Type II toxin-antitoxin system Phd/YefM family antitoxin n=1 Tax=Chelatococcus sambhunathii TaxID=363953 RepID=A0ABU1DE35_9HYPH|nr:hypothetical protein [Chelatococcus sambhunathii]MDR4306321.1 type II toxin-antitoxin system Phd/YefM family antitoxin [Chelatococcus sambhunathii]
MQRGITIRATEFSRNFGKYQDEAISAKVINITSHGRVVGAYLSAEELAHYERLKRYEREVLVAGSFDEETLAAIASTEYGVEPE